MISFGNNITQKNDPLQRINIELLYKTINTPKSELESQIEQLRTILSIDEQKYRFYKTRLPYVCCGLFKPAIRKIENFAVSAYFILDIDHIKDKNHDLQELKNKLIKDERIVLIFISPSNNGLKIMFRLTEKCYDSARFSLFYKLFAHSFSEQYNLQQVIDNRTSDVSRACFISVDKNAYYNAEATSVDMNALVNFENENEIREANIFIKQKSLNKEEKKPEIVKKELSDDVLQQIKQKLNPTIKIKKEKLIYVPEELERIIDKVKTQANDYNIDVSEISNINYGKKFRFKLNQHWSEINLFYGKKGFTVVKTPKKGSNPELMEICYKILCELFY